MGRNRWHFILQVCVCAWLPVCRTQCPLAGTNISTIPAGSLPPNITDMQVYATPVETIDDEAFDDSSSTLTRMMFSKIIFNRFPNAIGHLRALTYLSVTEANITDWNDDVWINIGGSLTTLKLDDVGMVEWPNWIQYCSDLSEITIVWSAISSIPDGALDSVAHSLTSLTLNNNQLTMVPKAFSNLNSLHTLDLGNNNITDISWLPQNSNLSTLTLSNNYIWDAGQLSEVLRPYNTSLLNLDIENNRLTMIPDVAFLVNVGVLQFTHNRISDPNSGAVPSNITFLDLTYNSLPFVPKMMSQLLNVTTLAVSNNVITAIRDTDFHQHLWSVELGFNLITELTDTSFPENFTLPLLDLHNNPLTKISSVACQHLPNLLYLDLSSTNLTRLPLALGYLKDLVSLDLNDNLQLVCTCTESSLTPWILNITIYNVYGNCGETSVYDFFSTLGPLCPSSE